MRRPGLLLLSLLLVWPAGLFAAHKVVRVSGDKVTVSVGSKGGVKAGFTGEVYYHLEIAGQKKRISVANFSVVEVGPRTSVVRVYNKKAPVNTGYQVRFNEKLVAQKVVVKPKPKGNVYVSSQPAGATVTINGRRVEKVTPCLVEGVVVGDARVELKKDFYFGTALVKVVKDQLSKVDVELKAEPAQVKFLSQPFEAKVFVDGELKGTTPVIVKALKAGRHEIRMEKASHFPKAETIFVKGGSKEEIKLTLEPFGEVRFALTPPDAELTVDGEARPCPAGACVFELPIGEHELLITRDKYLKHEKKLSLKVGDSLTERVALIGYPSVEITSSPEKVYVHLQGNKLGRTPLKLQFPDAGEYEFELSKDRYATQKVKVTLAAGKKEKLAVKLLALPKVVITTTPDDADVFLDGKKMGVTPLTLTMDKPGLYIFKVEKYRYKAAELRAQVDLGDKLKLKKKLDYQKKYALQLAREAATRKTIKKKTVLGWTFTGVGAATVGGSVPFFVSWLSKLDTAESEYDKYEQFDGLTEASLFDSTIKKAQSEADSSRTSFIVGASMAGVGVACLSYGVYNLLTVPEDPEKAAKRQKLLEEQQKKQEAPDTAPLGGVSLSPFALPEGGGGFLITGTW